MIISIAFCRKDSAACLSMLEWLHELCGHIPTLCVLAHETSVDATAHHQAASRVFSEVRHHTVSTLSDSWPHAPNSYFAQVAQAMAGQNLPWYFFEPDNLPLTPDFFARISNAYNGAGKPFMGAFFPSWFERGGVWAQSGMHMTGTGIYPAKFFQTSQLVRYILPAVRDDLTAKRIPKAFDVYLQGEVVPRAHRTSLIQHSWRSQNFRLEDCIRFEVIDPEHKGLAKQLQIRETIEPEAVVLHGCKDGSLLRLLRQLHSQGRLKEALALAQNATQQPFSPISGPSLANPVFQPFVPERPKRVVQQVDPWGSEAGFQPPAKVVEVSVASTPGAGYAAPNASVDPRGAASELSKARLAFRTAKHQSGCLSKVPSLHNDSLICDCGLRIALPPTVDWKKVWDGGIVQEAVYSEPIEGADGLCSATNIPEQKGGDDPCAPNSKNYSTGNPETPHISETAVAPNVSGSNGAAESHPQSAPKVFSMAAVARKGELMDIAKGGQGAISKLRKYAREKGVKDTARMGKDDLALRILEIEMGDAIYQ